MNKVTKVLDRLMREPVLIGAAVQAQLAVMFPGWSPAARVAVGAWVAFFQRVFSTSKRTADENAEVAKYVGAVEHQSIVQAGDALNVRRGNAKAR